MATTADVSAPTPEMVGNAFVEQYYNVLCQAPEDVHKFYQNISVISRPSDDNSMSSVSALDGIDKMVPSLGYKNCLVEILTVDSQPSVGEGVIVLVTGFFTGKDHLKRKFLQLFFLAPQEKSGYFVLNDVFRYVDGDGFEGTNIDDPVVEHQDGITNDAAIDPPTTPLHEDSVQDVDSNYQSDNGKIPITDKDDIADHPDDSIEDDATVVQNDVDQNDYQQASESSASNNNQEDVPKKSYASVANALNFKTQPFQQRASPAKPAGKPRVVAPPPQTSPRPTSNNNNNKTVERNNNHMVKGYSIFVANLPMDATPEQLREAFEKFGPIKLDGVQVRSYKQEKNCFGFVEFESAASMKTALEATVMIGKRRAHIEEKKANNDGKFPLRNSGFRNDGFRSRGNFPRGGYRRNEVENQDRISDQVLGQTGEGNSKNFPNGGGRVARQAQVVQAQGGKN